VVTLLCLAKVQVLVPPLLSPFPGSDTTLRKQMSFLNSPNLLFSFFFLLAMLGQSGCDCLVRHPILSPEAGVCKSFCSQTCRVNATVISNLLHIDMNITAI